MKRYESLQIVKGQRLNPSATPQSPQRTWSGEPISGRPNRRRTARDRVWVEKRVATRKKPVEVSKEVIEFNDLTA